MHYNSCFVIWQDPRYVTLSTFSDGSGWASASSKDDMALRSSVAHVTQFAQGLRFVDM